MQHHQLKCQTTNFLTDDEQAIVALCTPRGSGALALIRISGVNACGVANNLSRLSSGLSIAAVSTHTIHHGYVIDARGNNAVIDEVLFFVMHGPRTFTGQDTIEISCHNNHFIIDRIITCALAAGARAAKHGEFSKRAFLQGKIDLVQAEAINELITAPTEQALQQSLATVQGSLSSHIADITKRLTLLQGYVEASFEFLDEEQRDFDIDTQIRQRIQELLETIAGLKKHYSQQKYIKDGIRVALLGSVNAGKSTLFNALVGHERAIVADHAGTTRDSIETNIYSNGTFWLLIDTAGIRQTDDTIELKSIQRSLYEASLADIIVLVVDSTRELSEQELVQYQDLVAKYREKIIVVANKIDHTGSYDISGLPFIGTMPIIAVSAQQRCGVDVLQKALEEKMQALFAHLQSPFLLNQRHFALLTELEQGLQFIANMCTDGINYEVAACNLGGLQEKISELTGKNVTEKMLDAIFDEFCVGK